MNSRNISKRFHIYGGRGIMRRLNSFLRTFILFIFFLFITINFLNSTAIAGNLTSNATWEWKYPSPQGNSLQAVYFVNANEGYAVGDSGTILKTLDAGNTWVSLQTNSKTHLKDVFFVNSNIGYVIGRFLGVILKTVDGGTTWQDISLPETDYGLNSVWFTDENTGYVVGGPGRVWKTTNGGSSWLRLPPPPIQGNILKIQFVSSQVGYGIEYAAGNVFIKTTDGGQSWSAKSITAGNDWLQSMHFVGNVGYIVGNTGRIYKTTDGGDNWVPLTSGTTCDLTAVYFANSTTGYITGSDVSGNSILLSTTDGGANWAQVALGNIYAHTSYYSDRMGFTGLFFTDTQTGYAVAWNSYIVKITNGGTNWQRIGSGSVQTVHSMRFFDNQNGLAGASWNNDTKLTVFKTNDGGQSWSQNTFNIDCMRKAFFVSSNVWYALNYPGKIMKTVDAGQNWTEKTLPTTDWMESIYFIDENHGMVAGGNYKTYYTDDGGNTWAEKYIWCGNRVNDFLFTSSNNGYAVCDNGNGVIHKSTDGGRTWNHVYSAAGRLNSISFPSQSVGYAGGESGVYKTTDGGNNWLQIPGPNAGSGVEKLYFINEMQGFGISSIPGTSLGGALFRTLNGGTTWEWLPSGVPFIDIIFLNVNTGIGTSYNGGLLYKVGGSNIDTTPPTTTASPSGGIYPSAQNVTLTCNDGTGSGCQTTYYCLGSGCNPTTVYSGAITIGSSTVLRFYSKDNANNSESVKPETYTINIGATNPPLYSYTILHSYPTGPCIYPNSVAVDPITGDYFITDSGSPNYGTQNIYRMNKATGIIVDTISLNDMPLGACTGLVIDSITGNFFVSDYGEILEYARTGGVPIGGFTPPVGNILGLSWSETGNLLGTVAGSTPNGQIIEITKTGNLVRTINFVYPPRFAGINILQAYAYDKTTGIHFAGCLDFLIEIPDEGGTAYENLWFTLSNIFKDIRGADFDSEGHLIIVDRQAQQLYVLQQTISHTITASAGANGSISPSGAVTVPDGNNQLFTITPNQNYHVTNVLVDGSSVGAVTSYTFTNVITDHTISASFAINTVPTHTITASAGANGSVTPSGAITVNHNATKFFTVTHDSGYVTVMSGTCGGNLNGSTYKTNLITQDCTVIASFNPTGSSQTILPGDNVQVSVPVSLPSGGTGTVIIEFDQIVTGGTLNVTATDTPLGGGPPTGFKFLGTYYDVTFTGTFSGYIYITFPYNASSIPSGKEKNLKLFHWKNNGWEDCTVLPVDTANNRITGRVTSLSPFGFGYPFSSGSGSSSSAYKTGANENMIALIAILAISAGVFLLRRKKRWN
jgi:LPXTG-motif cell wall-anchored protein